MSERGELTEGSLADRIQERLEQAIALGMENPTLAAAITAAQLLHDAALSGEDPELAAFADQVVLGALAQFGRDGTITPEGFVFKIPTKLWGSVTRTLYPETPSSVVDKRKVPLERRYYNCATTRVPGVLMGQGQFPPQATDGTNQPIDMGILAVIVTPQV